MVLWGQARMASSNDDLDSAVKKYEELLAEKPKIEEALREYCSILMTLERWPEATTAVQKLLEIDPSSLEYLLYGGSIDLAEKRYERASRYLGQVYSMSPTGPYAIEALTGQISSLQRLGRLDMAYPLMEQLYLLIPHQEQPIRQLAKYSFELGYIDKATTYYKTLITEFGGSTNDFMDSAVLFEQAGDMEMAVLSWQGYLAVHPFYLPFHKKLSVYFLGKGRKSEALDHLLIQVAHGDRSPELFLQIGEIYLYTKGRPDKALHFYEEYKKSRPGDPHIASEIKRIQAVLANDLLVIVENEGAWSLWRDLAKVIPDRLAVYYSMARQLEKTDKRDELAEILEIIHFHNPGDQEILVKLASIYCIQGLYGNATTALKSITLPLPVQLQESYLKLRINLSEKINSPLQALAYAKEYLLLNPGDYNVILKSLQLAGDLGLMKDAQYFFDALAGVQNRPSLQKQGRIVYGEILLANGLSSKASQLFKSLLLYPGLSPSEKHKIKVANLAAIQGEGDLFVAEQELRHTLIRDKGDRHTVLGLVNNSLLEKNWNDAWEWYEFLVSLPKGNDQNLESIETGNLLLKIKILQESGQLSMAIELLEKYLNRPDIPCDDLQAGCFQASVSLAKLYYRVQRYDNTLRLLDTFPKVATSNNTVRALRYLLSLKMDRTLDGEKVADSVAPQVINRLDIARIFFELGELDLAIELCESFLAVVPDSVKAEIFYAELLQTKFDSSGPLKIYRDLLTRYPEECSFKQNLIEALFENSKFSELIDLLAPEWKTVPEGDTSLSVRQLVPEVWTIPVRQQLLLAKSLWAVQRHNDSLLLYNQILDPAVDQEFAKRIDSQGIIISLPVPRKSFLNSITLTTPAEPERLSVVMEPSFTLQNLQLPEVKIAADLYASYRWQQIIQKELSVRQAMSDQNYYQAMKEYQKFLRNEYSPESLFDLAGIYSRLGFLGREAALYETMKNKSPGYPDLIEASQRNSIKREPWVSPDLTFQKKEGRNGYYDIRQKSFGVTSWVMPSLEHEFAFNFSRIYSESLEDNFEQWRNHFDASLLWNPIYDLGFLFKIGNERLDDGEGNSLLFDVQLNGRVGDMVTATLEVSQNIVADTAQSIVESITARQYEAGLRLDLLPRLFGGGEFRFTEYSDGNHQNRYELWTSYLIHSEPTLLQVKYSYEYSRNAEGNLGQKNGELPGFSTDDYPYWSPREYWQHLFSLSFEHQLADDIFGRSTPSYYILEYSFGYELGGYANHRALGQIFLEMNRHFLLNSTIELIRGTDFEVSDLFFSIIYRW